MSIVSESPSPSGEGLGWGTERHALELSQRAKAMRSTPTEPEKRLWRHLSSGQLEDFKFRRQAVIGDRIVDFFCPAIGLIVEVDGDTHNATSDQAKDAAAANLGFATIRFTNSDVVTNIDGVLAAILGLAKSLPPRARWRLPTPTPPLKGRG